MIPLFSNYQGAADKAWIFSTNQCLPSEESCFDASCVEREIKHTSPESRIGLSKNLIKEANSLSLTQFGFCDLWESYKYLNGWLSLQLNSLLTDPKVDPLKYHSNKPSSKYLIKLAKENLLCLLCLEYFVGI